MKVLKGGTLIDGTGAGPVAGATIVVRDRRIEAIATEPAATGRAMPRSSTSQG